MVSKIDFGYMAHYYIRKVVVSSFRYKMAFSSTISCNGVSLVCDGLWVDFGDGLKRRCFSNRRCFFVKWLTEMVDKGS